MMAWFDSVVPVELLLFQAQPDDDRDVLASLNWATAFLPGDLNQRLLEKYLAPGTASLNRTRARFSDVFQDFFGNLYTFVAASKLRFVNNSARLPLKAPLKKLLILGLLLIVVPSK